MLSDTDRRLILNVIRTGNFLELINLKLDLKQFTRSALVAEFHKNDTLKFNFELAKRVANLLLIKEGKLKRSITQLVALELNNYADQKTQRNKVYRQINQLASNLVSYPENKRVAKFLVKFTKASKVLQSTVKNEENFIIFKIFQNINSEVKC